MQKDIQAHPKHPFRARAAVALIMLALSFVGLVITDIKRTGALTYWQIMVPIFALLCLGLSLYIRRTVDVIRPVSIWHEVLHWVGLGGSVCLVWYFVRIGSIGRFEAGLFVLTLLALATFLVGVYVDYSFLIIGLMLGIFAGAAAFVEEYLFSIMLPLTIAVGAGLYFFIRYRHRFHQSGNDEEK